MLNVISEVFFGGAPVVGNLEIGIGSRYFLSNGPFFESRSLCAGTPSLGL